MVDGGVAAGEAHGRLPKAAEAGMVQVGAVIDSVGVFMFSFVSYLMGLAPMIKHKLNHANDPTWGGVGEYFIMSISQTLPVLNLNCVRPQVCVLGMAPGPRQMNQNIN